MDEQGKPDEPAVPDADSAEEVAQVEESSPAEVPEPELPAEPEQAKSLEDRIKGLESRLKIMTFLVTVMALVAPAVSAYAALQSASAAAESAKAASRSSEIAAETLEGAGADFGVSAILKTGGVCGNDEHPMTAVVRLTNSGRLASRAMELELRLDVPEGYDQDRGLSELGVQVIGSADEPVVVNAQDVADVPVRLDCDLLERLGADSGDVTGYLYRDVMRRYGSELTVMTSFALRVFVPSFFTHIEYQGLEYP